MEDWTQYIILPVVGYLAIQNMQQGRQMAIINTKVTELNTKMNLFLKTETDLLKDIVAQNTQTLKDIVRNRHNKE
jgi:hypothetical protein